MSIVTIGLCAGVLLAIVVWKVARAFGEYRQRVAMTREILEEGNLESLLGEGALGSLGNVQHVIDHDREDLEMELRLERSRFWNRLAFWRRVRFRRSRVEDVEPCPGDSLDVSYDEGNARPPSYSSRPGFVATGWGGDITRPRRAPSDRVPPNRPPPPTARFEISSPTQVFGCNLTWEEAYKMRDRLVNLQKRRDIRMIPWIPAPPVVQSPSPIPKPRRKQKTKKQKQPRGSRRAET